MSTHASGKCQSGFLLSGLLLIFAGSAQAAILASSAVTYDEGLGRGDAAIYGSGNSNPSAAGYTSPSGSSAASGYAETSYGALHASAAAIVAGNGFMTAQMRGQGEATWIDQLTFSNSALTGTSAFAHATFVLSGGLASYSDVTGVGAMGNSTIAAVIQINGTNVFSTSGQLISRNGAITTDDKRRGVALNGLYYSDPVSSLSGTFSFDIPFTFGTAFQMMADMTAFTQALAAPTGEKASAYSSFGSTGYWGGISNVHLADGTILGDYSLNSASGFDWTQAYPVTPVPVPATAWLFGTGLLGLIGRARCRKPVH